MPFLKLIIAFLVGSAAFAYTDINLISTDGKVFGTQTNPLYMVSTGTTTALASSTYRASSGVQAATLSLGNLRFAFGNPAGSGVNITINSIATYNSLSTPVTATLYINPTSAPSSGGYIKNALFTPSNTNNVGKGFVYSDLSATAMGGGTAIGNIVIPPGKTVFSQDKYVLQPGVMVGFNVGLGGIATSEVVIYYSETPQ